MGITGSLYSIVNLSGSLRQAEEFLTKIVLCIYMDCMCGNKQMNIGLSVNPFKKAVKGCLNIFFRQPLKILSDRAGAALLLIIAVSIGIIGILIMMTIPMLQAVRETERKVTCIQNLKTIGKALEVYRADYSDCLPFAGNSTNMMWDGTRKRKVFLGVLYPDYVKDIKRLYCPTQKLYKESSEQYGMSKFLTRGVKCCGSYFARGSMQFDSNLQPDTCINPNVYPKKLAWVTDYNVSGTPAIAHKGRGIHVLVSDGSVFYINGSYQCETETDLHGDMFWKTIDRKCREKIERMKLRRIQKEKEKEINND